MLPALCRQSQPPSPMAILSAGCAMDRQHQDAAAQADVAPAWSGAMHLYKCKGGPDCRAEVIHVKHLQYEECPDRMPTMRFCRRWVLSSTTSISFRLRWRGLGGGGFSMEPCTRSVRSL